MAFAITISLAAAKVAKSGVAAAVVFVMHVTPTIPPSSLLLKHVSAYRLHCFPSRRSECCLSHVFADDCNDVDGMMMI